MPREKDSDPQLVGFHLSITMGYLDYAPFFCAATEMVKDRALYTLHVRGTAPYYPLENWWKLYYHRGMPTRNSKRRRRTTLREI